MSLRSKLSNRSAFIFSGTLGFVLLGTYFLFQQHTSDLYYKKLLERAHTAAFFYLEKDELSSQKYREIEKRYKQGEGESIRLYYAQTGHIFIDDTLRYELPETTLSTIISTGSHTFRIGERQLAGILYKDNQGDFIIVASGINNTGNTQLVTLRWSLIIFFIVGLALNYIMTGWLARQTFRPFSKLISNVNSITTDNLHMRLDLPPGRPDEMKDLITTFNYFLQRLDEGVQSQRNFLKNASHEIKTPLAVIIGGIEVALKNPRDNAEYVSLLESLKKDTLHLSSIMEGLLMLSGLEMSGRQQMEPVRIDEILWNVLEKAEIEYPQAQIAVNFDSMAQQERLLTMNANRQLLFVALSNLLDNAIKFSISQPVSVIVEAINDALVIGITDSGPGIPATEKEAIFELFYRSNQTRHIPGHGIGLHLTRQILSLHSISLQIDSPAQGGTSIRLFFPAAGKSVLYP